MKLQNIAVFNRIRNRVGMQILLKNIFRRLVRPLLTFKLYIASILLKNRRTRKAKKLSIRKELLNRLMILSKLRSMTLIENKHHPLITQRCQSLLVVTLVRTVQG